MKKKRCAVFTIAHNEKYFLPLWIKYYSQFFGMENLYILDHQSTDGSTSNLDCNVQVVKHKRVHDSKWLIETAKDEQKRLLQDYEYVMHPDADEFIIPDPDKHENLSYYVDYMRENSIDVVACFGHEVIHKRHEESLLDWGKSILVNQRKYWINLNTYDKPIIGSRFINWSWGTHFEVDISIPGRKEVPVWIERDNNLLLVHLRRVDFETCRETALSKYKSGTSGTKASQYIGEEFIEYFDNPQHWKNPDCLPGIVTEIPERFKNIV